MQLNISLIRKLLIDALKEDLVEADVTTEILIPGDFSKVEARIIAKAPGVLAGIEVIKEIFRLVSPEIKFGIQMEDGNSFSQGDILLELEGFASAILGGERVALNFLQRLSGIATLTRKFVEIASPYGVKILDTRKTTPNLRYLEKYAVRVGGGVNHRFNLAGGILIKDNHIKIMGGVRKAVEVARKNAPPFSKIEVEVADITQVKEAIEAKVDGVMLDNFQYEFLEETIRFLRRISPQTFIEVSGGIDLENVEKVARLKPDFISIGKLTSSAPSVDMSLKII